MNVKDIYKFKSNGKTPYDSSFGRGTQQTSRSETIDWKSTPVKKIDLTTLYIEELSAISDLLKKREEELYDKYRVQTIEEARMSGRAFRRFSEYDMKQMTMIRWILYGVENYY